MTLHSAPDNNRCLIDALSIPEHILLSALLAALESGQQTFHLTDLIAKLFPGSDEIYTLPLFELLADKPIRKTTLKRIVAPYLKPVFDGLSYAWYFPQPKLHPNANYHFHPILLNSPTRLYERGDLWGFTGILYLLRMAEAEKRSSQHATYMKLAYRAFPGLCRHKYLKKYWKDLYKCLVDLHRRVETSCFLVRPKMPVIEKQIFSKIHITDEIYWYRVSRISPKARLPELPYEESSF